MKPGDLLPSSKLFLPYLSNRLATDKAVRWKVSEAIVNGDKHLFILFIQEDDPEGLKRKLNYLTSTVLGVEPPVDPVDRAVTRLNAILDVDHDALRRLVLLCTPVSPEVRYIGIVSAHEGPRGANLGVLGLINAILGGDGSPGPVAANFKLACLKGCTLPEGEELRIGGPCPICLISEPHKRPGVVGLGRLSHFFKLVPED